MTWAKTRALFGLDDVALKGLLSVKQSGSNAIERTAGIDATFPLPLAAAKARFNRTHSGRSAWVAGTAIHAPYLPFAILVRSAH